ncbi:hypothetical protein [Sphingomonas kyeonggiensis]|uniref:DGQHR domain-containing protein n=1 Tax=Sphingomonas kyeonggiensis TaxID=1268553 RepID=A0A7W6JVT0_9SPHN|nr:hypothetical protein [Sphingomonas kyeonggiensis]MBB4100483.1 hypothetical protein [Sphingomonas kyeonggiensis]
MPNLIYQYNAQRFRPRADGEQELLLFVAPAADIRTWAGVPRKAFDYQHGFQRTLNPARVKDVAQYFRESPRNISPTSVVVGFTGAVEMKILGEELDGIEPVQVTITLPDYTKMSIEELTATVVGELRMRIPDEAGKVDQDLENRIADAVRLEDDEAVDSSFGIATGSEENTDSDSGLDSIADAHSYLADFYAQLRGFQEKAITWPDERQLREVLYSILRPAIIVDGQHRVFGGAVADPDMRFAICALPGSSWAESVYQFVVINQKAKPIKPAFLSSIIATSLNTTEIAEVYDRLRSSRIDVVRAETMERVNTDPSSPFRSTIDFEVEGSPGFLQFPGMARLVRDFQNIPRSAPVLLPNGEWDEAVEGDALDQFFAFWSGVKDYFDAADDRLWRRPTADNPNRLLMIVTLQEMQGLMLDSWADSRVFKLGLLADVREQARRYWDGFPSTFFTDEWRQKGLQTSTGRTIVRDAMLQTRRKLGEKNWSHRRLKLFSD